jgi:hypothetical protein
MSRKSVSVGLQSRKQKDIKIKSPPSTPQQKPLFKPDGSGIMIQNVINDQNESVTVMNKSTSCSYTPYKVEELPTTQGAFTNMESISNLYRSMFEYVSPFTNECYIAKVTCVEKPDHDNKRECRNYKRGFIQGYEMESLVYKTLKGDPSISERVAWNDSVHKTELSAVIYIESVPISLDFHLWAENIDFSYEHFCVVIMRKKPNTITLKEYVSSIYKRNCVSPLEVSTIVGVVLVRALNVLIEWNSKFSFVHCDFKHDNILVNKHNPMDITVIDFDLCSILNISSMNQGYYSNPKHLMNVSNKKEGILFDIFRLYTSVSTSSHIPFFCDNLYFSDLHTILCTAPDDENVKYMERVDSQYNFLNDMLYFNKWYETIDYDEMVLFITKDNKKK